MGNVPCENEVVIELRANLVELLRSFEKEKSVGGGLSLVPT